MSSIPNCLIIPSASGSLSNCVTMKMPSVATMAVMMIIAWGLFLLVAYIIYYFFKKIDPMQKVNYWIILIILLLTAIIIGLLGSLL